MKKIPELDGIRGIAILTVILFHCLRFAHDFPELSVLDLIFGSMWVGVDLFFVLSGFLITSILLSQKNSEHRLRNFYVRRTLRIFPLYFIVLGLVTVFALSGVSPFSQVQGELATHFTYTFNIRVALLGWPDSSLLNHFWSLCIEEQFYLVWPFLAFGCSPRTLKRILIGAIVCSLCLRLSILQVWHSWEAEYTFPLCRLDGLAFGALLALENASEQRDFRLLKRLGMVSIVISVLLFVLFRGFRLENAELMAVLPTVIAAAYLPLFCNVLTVEDSPLKTMLRSRWLAWLGTLSYGLYVYHQIIRVLVQEYWGIRESILGTLVIGGSSLILSLISFRFVETYFLNQKTKFAPHEPAGPVSNRTETVSSN